MNFNVQNLRYFLTIFPEEDNSTHTNSIQKSLAYLLSLEAKRLSDESPTFSNIYQFLSQLFDVTNAKPSSNAISSNGNFSTSNGVNPLDTALPTEHHLELGHQEQALLSQLLHDSFRDILILENSSRRHSNRRASFVQPYITKPEQSRIQWLLKRWQKISKTPFVDNIKGRKNPLGIPKELLRMNKHE